MKMKRILLQTMTITITASLLTTCTADKDNVSIVDSAVSLPEDARITLARAGARCPYYVVVVDNVGAVEFIGLACTTTKGRAYDTVELATVQKALRAVDELDFWSLDDTYESVRDPGVSAMDREFVKITVRAGGAQKAVMFDTGPEGTEAPSRLVELEHRIDDLLETAKWISGREE